MRELYSSKGRPFKLELKAANLEDYDRVNIAKQAVKFISSGRIQIHAVTVTKENVNLHIREDENMIYNYMVKQCILTEIAKYPSVVILPDKKNTKMRLANSLDLYLKLQLFEELESETRVEFKPQESHNNYRVQFADYIANIIWRRFELREQEAYQILHQHIQHKMLFPRKR